MNKRFSTVSGIILLAVFAFFFASTNFCIHIHNGPEGKIVHSHPWSGKPHNHTTSQVQLISTLTSCVFDAAPLLDNIGTPDIHATVLGSDNPDKCLFLQQFDAFCLRGPPMFI